eukprot:6475490-Amphidinium_carterae.2
MNATEHIEAICTCFLSNLPKYPAICCLSAQSCSVQKRAICNVVMPRGRGCHRGVPAALHTVVPSSTYWSLASPHTLAPSWHLTYRLAP